MTLTALITGLVALASLALFAAALAAFGALRVGASVLATARAALAVLRDPAQDDAAREQAMRRASLSLFAAAFSILARSALALAAATLPVWLAGFAGLAAPGAVLAFLARWDVLALTGIAMLAGYAVWKRRSPPRPAVSR